MRTCLMIWSIAALGNLAVVTSAAGQNAPAAEPQTVQVSASFASKATYAPVQFEWVKGLILFRAKVAGRELWMLLDNQSERSLIDTAFAQAAGLKIDPPSGTVKTPMGSLPKRPVWDVPVSVAGQLDLRTPMAAVDLSQISKFNGRKIEAILGGEWFGLLAFLARSHTQTLELVPSGTLNATGPFVPLLDDQPTFEGTVGGKPVKLKLDLGSNAMLTLTPAAWARVAPAGATVGKAKKSWADGRVYEVEGSILPEAQVGGFFRRDFPVIIDDKGLDGVDGVIGAPFLTDQDFAIDIKLRKMWILPAVTPQ